MTGNALDLWFVIARSRPPRADLLSEMTSLIVYIDGRCEGCDLVLTRPLIVIAFEGNNVELSLSGL